MFIAYISVGNKLIHIPKHNPTINKLIHTLFITIH